MTFTVHLEAEAKIEANVDIAAWYTAMTPANRAAYVKWDSADDENIDEECEPWEKPLRFLEGWFIDSAEASSGLGGLRPMVDDQSDITEFEHARVTSGEKYRGKWTREDYAALTAAVPWLAALDKSPAELAELVRTMPLPEDQPLFEVTP